MAKHRTTREGDEYVCSCGLRWDIHEDDPHEQEDEDVMWSHSTQWYRCERVLLIGVIYTVISFARSYLLRRFYNCGITDERTTTTSTAS